MTWLTHARLRRDTPRARHLARLLLEQGRWDSGHGLVWTLFADEPDARRDFLFREVAAGEFLLVSTREPQAEPALWRLSSKPYAPPLALGDRYKFGLRANPTVSVSQLGRARSRRVDVFLHAKKQKGSPLEPSERETVALAWLFERAETLGVAFEESECRTARRDELSIPRADAKPARITLVDYEGLLTVRDPVRLGKALTTGVGHGKAYGAGLLLLRRPDV